MSAVLIAHVPAAAAGRRLDQTLAELFPDYSRARLSGWIRTGRVRVDGGDCSPSQRLHGGERIALEPELEQAVPAAPEAIALQLLHVDDDLLVLNKPAGLVVHPGAGVSSGTLQNALLHFDASLGTLPRAGIVHRLDKDTSGLMLVARSLRAHTALTQMIAARAVQRQYLALVRGEVIAGGTVDAPLGRHPVDRLRQAVRDDGRPARTHYRVRERLRGHTLLHCTLESGRTHQIRVHMAHSGHPLIGDPLYGGGLRLPPAATPQLIAALRAFQRQALHAERLAFVHPFSAAALEFSAPLPADFIALLDVLRRESVISRA
ncbi:MAG: 23S rRNA pseudouridine(1911/1915/1917) synthase RluD [Metallibacterium scheffleri]|jgi:23S rRNA pseudouridine1911/1915/1917 synthase